MLETLREFITKVLAPRGIVLGLLALAPLFWIWWGCHRSPAARAAQVCRASPAARRTAGTADFGAYYPVGGFPALAAVRNFLGGGSKADLTKKGLRETDDYDR
jgi:hypothetical protein